jgi:hypothetical protein
MEQIRSDVCITGHLTCVGCCGKDFTSREEIEKAVQKNTKEFMAIKNKHKFMKRKDNEFLHDCGICRNVIYTNDDEDDIMCPLHPFFNDDNTNKDIRKGHCEIEYLCKTAYVYNKYDNQKRKKFQKFILKKDLDWLEFSVGMNNDSFLEEFEKSL